MLRIEELLQVVDKDNYLKIINSLTGLNAFGSEPGKPEISVIYPGLRSYEEPKEELMDFISLFTKAPPFEPLSYPEVKIGNTEFQGAHVWFILNEGISLTKNKEDIDRYARRRDVSSIVEENHPKDVTGPSPDTSPVILGIVKGDKKSNLIRIDKIITINLLSLYRSSVAVEVSNESSHKHGYVSIEYGAGYLNQVTKKLCGHMVRSLRDAGECLDKVSEWLRKQLGSSGSKSYYIGSLDYITYCYGGRYITTDPLANRLKDVSKFLKSEGFPPINPVCPPCRSRDKSPYLCRPDSGRGIFYYSRRVFPKIYPRFKYTVEKKWSASEIPAPFTVELVGNTELLMTVEELSANLPTGPLKIKLSSRPYAKLRRTNGIVVLINRDFVEALVGIIHSAKKNFQTFFLVPGRCADEKWPLYDVLYAKYLLSEFDGVFGIDYQRGKSGPRISVRGGEGWEWLWQKREKDPINTRFVNFVGRVLSHTIAHVLIQKVSDALGISMNNLVYIYGEGEDSNYLVAGVFEYSKGGVLQLNEELAEYVKKEYAGLDEDTALKMFFIDAVKESLGVYGKYGTHKDDEVIHKLLKEGKDCGEARKRIDEIIDAYSPLGKELVKSIAKNLENYIREFADYLDSKRLRFDFTTFKYLIEKAIHRRNGPYDKIMSRIEEKVGEKSNKALLRQFVNDLIDTLIEYYAPPICMDGCSYDIHLERDCSEAVFENILTSRGLLEAFATVAGFWRGGTISVTSESLYALLSSARRELEVRTAFTSRHMIDALKGVIKDKKREKVRVRFILSKDRKDEESLISKIKEVGSELRRRFEFKFTEEASHEKGYVVDDIDVTTSWNFTSPTRKKYESVSFHYRPLERNARL